MTTESSSYPVRLEVDYPEKLDRFTTFFRLIWALPILVVIGILNAGASDTWTVVNEQGEVIETVSWATGGVTSALFMATLLLIVFRQKYPRWWFDFALEFSRFSSRVGAYLGLLTDRYPSTTDEQAVHLEIDYPEVEQDLNRWLPLVKWFLAIPHYIVLAFLFVGVFVVVTVAWFAILFTGRYPRGMFDYVVGVGRWALRVAGYVTLLVTDDYPPFSLS